MSMDVQIGAWEKMETLLDMFFVFSFQYNFLMSVPA